MINKRIPELNKLRSPILIICVIGAFFMGITFSSLGVLLVCLGAQGQTEITLFQLSFHSTNIGISAIFIGAVVTLYIVHSVLALFEKLKNGDDMSKSCKKLRLYSDLEKLIHKMNGQKGDEYGEDTKL